MFYFTAQWFKNKIQRSTIEEAVFEEPFYYIYIYLLTWKCSTTKFDGKN